MMKHTAHSRWGWGLAMVLALLWTTALSAQAESKASVRTVRGEVVAVNVQDSPNVIVVKAMAGKQQEFIVGATIAADTKVMRGKQSVALSQLKVGETVDLTYVKQEDGLVARSIHAR